MPFQGLRKPRALPGGLTVIMQGLPDTAPRRGPAGQRRRWMNHPAPSMADAPLSGSPISGSGIRFRFSIWMPGCCKGRALAGPAPPARRAGGIYVRRAGIAHPKPAFSCTGTSFCRAAFAYMRPHNGEQGLCRSMPLCGKALFPVRKASYKKSREKEQNEKMKMAKGG